MYSLFIGLTLGGLPVVYRMVKPLDASAICSATIAFAAMIIFAWMQFSQKDGGGPSGWPMLVLGGIGGASAMILPGVSGGYVLLLLGQYVPILDGVDAFKTALSERDFSAAMVPAFQVMLPVGIGVIVGIVVVSNLLKWLLKNHRKTTLGFLIGLLLGSVLGLFPFQESVEPEIGQKLKGRVVTEANMEEFEPKDWPTRFFTPTVVQIAASLGLAIFGVGVTVGIAKLGNPDRDKKTPGGNTS